MDVDELDTLLFTFFEQMYGTDNPADKAPVELLPQECKESLDRLLERAPVILGALKGAKHE